MEDLPIRKFYGVGKVTTEKMYQLGIFTGTDLKSKSQEFLEKHFGKSGTFYYKVVRGINNSEVKPFRVTKSVAAEHTFDVNLSSEIFMLEQLDRIAGTLEKRLKKHKISGKTVTLKIKYSDFKRITRSLSFPNLVSDIETIKSTAKQLLISSGLEDKKIRLLGITLSNFGTEISNSIKSEETGQLRLF